jgi:hypothetical protein
MGIDAAQFSQYAEYERRDIAGGSIESADIRKLESFKQAAGTT